MIEAILKQFGVKATKKEPLKPASVWLIDDELILKQSSPRSIARSAELSKKLADAGISVPVYIRALKDSYVYEVHGNTYCLMTKLIGEHIDPYGCSSHEIGHTLGLAIADLDNALRGITIANVHNADLEREMHGWILREISKSEIAFDTNVIPACAEWLELYRTLPRQLIHRDLHADNMLFHGDNFVGFIDFDRCQINARVFDLCYFGCTSLSEGYEDEKHLTKWEKLFSALLQGYCERCPLNVNELKAIPMMFVMIEIIFTAFYCKTDQFNTAQKCADFTNWLYRNQDALSAIVS